MAASAGPSRFRSPRIQFGKGALKYLSGLDGKKAFVVTDAVLQKLGVVAVVEEQLKKGKMEVAIFAEVEPEPAIATIERGAARMREFGPDHIVAVGGGSSMDAAKAMWILYENPDWTVKNFKAVMGKVGLRKRAKLITVPTTSGTGSDVTWAFIITDPAEKRKMTFACSDVVADVSLLDPLLTRKMPPRVTADTGMDALCHAIEAYTCAWKNDVSDGLALHAIRLAFAHLERAYKNGDDLVAREKMHNASTIAGLAFGNSQVGNAHAMGHALGGTFGVPHGRAVGLFLPYVVEFNGKSPKVAPLYGDVARMLDLGSTPQDLAGGIFDLLRRLEQPTRLADIVPADQFEARFRELVTKAQKDLCAITNPVTPAPREWDDLFRRTFSGP
ncbi:MAG: iron-containing alcohol dehydrogenase [Halobacteria archaeon]